MNITNKLIVSLLIIYAALYCTSSEALATNKKQIQEILDTTQIKGGLIVHAGCDDGELTTALRLNDSCIVQGLDIDKNKVQNARRYIQSQGLYGSVTADTFNGKHLPYTDNLVNLLIVSKNYDVSRQEMMRVLAPLGEAYVKQNGEWQKLTKPWPQNIDEWTHYLHGADNNAVANDTVVGPPRHMQWLGAPLWSRNHHKLCSISSVVTARGKIFYIMDESPAANINIPGNWAIAARDAFSGIELWKKEMDSWAWHKIRFRSGPPQVTRLLVVSDDRLYMPLGLNEPVSVLDADTGDTMRSYDNTTGAEEFILIDGILLVLKGSPIAEQARDHPFFKEEFKFPNQKSIVAIQTETGSTLWEWTDPKSNPMPETLASDGRKVYFQAGESVVCLDLKSGDELWTYNEGEKRVSRKKLTYGQHVLVVKNGVVLCKLSNKLTAISAENGEKLWECKAGGGFHSPLDIFVIDNLVWQGLHVSDSVSPPPVDDFDKGRDLFTGEVKRSNNIMVDLQTSGHHHRCYREKATERYIITGKRGIEMMDLQGDNHSRNNWVRGTCQYGILPANGLIYAPPHACGCYMESKLWGFWSLAAEKSEIPKVPQEQRLEKGPAYKTLKDNVKVDNESWPQYRHDSLRSGISETVLPVELKPAWETELGDNLTQPVITGSKVLVCKVDAGIVYALDENDGSQIWSYTTSGRIDSPPTIHEGKVLFGSADGYVYCLRLTDGALMWRFLAARGDRKAVARDQVESLWPVHGSVLIHDDIAYFSAGRSSWLDGGIELYGLNPGTGEIVYHNHFESQHPKLKEGKDQAKPEYVSRIDQNTTDYKTFLAPDKSDAFSMAGGVVSDVLVSDGRDVFMHHLRFNAELEKQDNLKPHLFSTSSLLDGVENHRSHWVLGTGDFSRVPVAYSWIVNRPGKRMPTIAVPTGVMMVYDDQDVWGVQRKGDANGRYHLYRKENKPFKNAEKSLPDFRKIPPEQPKESIWQQDLPVHPRAMLKSGDNLYLGVMPVEIPQKNPLAAYEGKKGGQIWVFSAKDGTKLAEYNLPSPVIWDGMAAANGHLFLSTYNGTVHCFSKDK